MTCPVFVFGQLYESNDTSVLISRDSENINSFCSFINTKSHWKGLLAPEPARAFTFVFRITFLLSSPDNSESSALDAINNTKSDRNLSWTISVHLQLTTESKFGTFESQFNTITYLLALYNYFYLRAPVFCNFYFLFAESEEKEVTGLWKVCGSRYRM